MVSVTNTTKMTMGSSSSPRRLRCAVSCGAASQPSSSARLRVCAL
jgi:hypothetical protein